MAEHPSAPHRRLAPLRVAPYRRLLAGYTVNNLGDRVGVVALAVLVYAETRDPLATTALFVAAEFIPALVAPALTARVDHLALRRSLPVLYAVEGVFFAILAILAARDFALTPILLLAYLDGVLMLTARGLLRSAVSGVLEPAGLLREGNALLNLGYAVAGIGGAALGGLLVEAFGASTALAINAVSFLVIAVLLVTARGLPRPAHEPAPSGSRLREGLRWVWSERVPRALFTGQALALVLFTLIVPIEVVYAAETLGTDESGYGLLLAAWGAGALLGSFLFLSVTHLPASWLILGATLAIGLAYAGMSATTTLWVACALSVLGGGGNGVQWVSVMTRLQEETPAALQARVAGLLESVASAMTGVGFVVGGVLTAITSPPTAFAVAGIGLIVLVAAAAVVLRPSPAAA